MTFAGDVVVAVGIGFILIGVIGIHKFHNFYERLLVTAKIDTVGAFTVILGVAVKHGFSFFSLKALLLIAVLMLINPLASHLIARSAYLSGYKTGDGDGRAEHYDEGHV